MLYGTAFDTLTERSSRYDSRPAYLPGNRLSGALLDEFVNTYYTVNFKPAGDARDVFQMQKKRAPVDGELFLWNGVTWRFYKRYNAWIASNASAATLAQWEKIAVEDEKKEIEKNLPALRASYQRPAPGYMQLIPGFGFMADRSTPTLKVATERQPSAVPIETSPGHFVMQYPGNSQPFWPSLLFTDMLDPVKLNKGALWLYSTNFGNQVQMPNGRTYVEGELRVKDLDSGTEKVYYTVTEGGGSGNFLDAAAPMIARIVTDVGTFGQSEIIRAVDSDVADKVDIVYTSGAVAVVTGGAAGALIAPSAVGAAIVAGGTAGAASGIEAAVTGKSASEALVQAAESGAIAGAIAGAVSATYQPGAPQTPFSPTYDPNPVATITLPQTPMDAAGSTLLPPSLSLTPSPTYILSTPYVPGVPSGGTPSGTTPSGVAPSPEVTDVEIVKPSLLTQAGDAATKATTTAVVGAGITAISAGLQKLTGGSAPTTEASYDLVGSTTAPAPPESVGVSKKTWLALGAVGLLAVLKHRG